VFNIIKKGSVSFSGVPLIYKEDSVEGSLEAEDNNFLAEPICPVFSFSNSIPGKCGRNSWSRFGVLSDGCGTNT